MQAGTKTRHLFADMLARVCGAAAAVVGPDADLSRIVVEPPRDSAHGDMATNAAMVLAKDAGRKPRELAESIAALGQDSDSPAGLLYFHSALQGQALYGLPELDTAYVRRDLGEAELAGFASYVLFAPMLGRSQFHHFSSVLVGLGCRADQGAGARVGSGPGRRIE